MTEKTKTETGRERVLELRKLHQPVLDALGVPDAIYLPKMFYKPPGKSELHVSFFKSELQRGQDIYTEMTDRDFISEDPSRKLYRWKYNPQWAEDYKMTDNPPVRYLIPMSELKEVYPKPGKAVEEEVIGDCSGDDCSINEMSMRDLYAIINNAPVSSKRWLNKLIELQTKRDYTGPR